MSFFEIFLISVGLGMDALSVSICKGLAMKKMNWRKAIIIGLYFGAFQALMPIIGFIIGAKFQKIVESLSHWVAFIILVIIGINMIIESLKKEDNKLDDCIDFKSMIFLSLATSIDALAVGVTFAILNVNNYYAYSVIGIVTFIMSFIGVKIGCILGEKVKNSAEILGGSILITIGIKLLIA